MVTGSAYLKGRWFQYNLEPKISQNADKAEVIQQFDGEGHKEGRSRSE